MCSCSSISTRFSHLRRLCVISLVMLQLPVFVLLIVGDSIEPNDLVYSRRNLDLISFLLKR